LSKGKKLIFFVFFASLVLAYYQTVRIDAPNYDLKFKRHSEIISNTVEYPYKYRLINPYIANVTFTVFKMAVSEKAAFLLAYFIQNLIVYGFLIFAVRKFMSLWFDDTGAIIATLLFALIVPLSLTGYDTLGDMTTAGMMALAFCFINTKKISWLYLLIFIGAFNELQLVLMVAFYFIGSKGNITNKHVWLNSIGLVAVFLVAYALIYLIRGGHAEADDYKWYFTKDSEFNIAHKDWIILWLILIAPFIPFVFTRLSIKPDFLKRNFLVTLPLFYFASFFFIARLREIDKALTIFLILIPLALITIIPKHLKESTVQS
jgi:hypothetical protein